VRAAVSGHQVALTDEIVEAEDGVVARDYYAELAAGDARHRRQRCGVDKIKVGGQLCRRPVGAAQGRLGRAGHEEHGRGDRRTENEDGAQS